MFDLREKEIELTEKFVREMARLSKEKDVPFVFVTLPTGAEGGYKLPGYLSRALSETDSVCLNVQEADQGFILGDSHPNPDAHAAIADLIANASMIQEILGRVPVQVR